MSKEKNNGIDDGDNWQRIQATQPSEMEALATMSRDEIQSLKKVEESVSKTLKKFIGRTASLVKKVAANGLAKPQINAVAHFYEAANDSGYAARFPIKAGTVGLLSGSGGAGKSYLALKWLIDALKPYDGENRLMSLDDQEKPVLYISCEDDEDSILSRFIDLGGNIEVLNRLDIYAAIDCPPEDSLKNFYDDVFFTALRKSIEIKEYQVVILDPMIYFARPNESENDNAAMGALMKRFQDAVKGLQCALILVSHTRKDTNGGGDSNIRGASAIINGVRWAATLTDKAMSFINAERDIDKRDKLKAIRKETLDVQDSLKTLNFEIVKANNAAPISLNLVMTKGEAIDLKIDEQGVYGILMGGLKNPESTRQNDPTPKRVSKTAYLGTKHM